jgi:GxxExxY protein
MLNHEKHEKEILYKEECYAIQGAVFNVYREMVCGFFEAVYQKCLEREFTTCCIPFQSQQRLELFFKGVLLNQFYEPDFICYGEIIVEIKATREIAPDHQAQVLNYLKGTKKSLGLLVNFGHYPKVQIERKCLFKQIILKKQLTKSG